MHEHGDLRGWTRVDVLPPGMQEERDSLPGTAPAGLVGFLKRLVRPLEKSATGWPGRGGCSRQLR